LSKTNLTEHVIRPLDARRMIERRRKAKHAAVSRIRNIEISLRIQGHPNRRRQPGVVGRLGIPGARTAQRCDGTVRCSPEQVRLADHDICLGGENRANVGAHDSYIPEAQYPVIECVGDVEMRRIGVLVHCDRPTQGAVVKYPHFAAFHKVGSIVIERVGVAGAGIDLAQNAGCAWIKIAGVGGER
jgi:hypothetical protein